MVNKKKKSRRSFLALVAGSASGGLSSLIIPNAAYSQTGFTDSDPNDPIGNGRGTGFTDSDPNDLAGNGRGNSTRGDSITSGPTFTDNIDFQRGGNNSGRTGFTDNDPNDPQGNGRGTGFTDNDPTDASGNGRGSSVSSGSSGITDNDPNDPVGNGRGNGGNNTNGNPGSQTTRRGSQVAYGDTRAEAYERALEKVDSPDSCGRRSSPSGNFVTDYTETAGGWRVEISYDCF